MVSENENNENSKHAIKPGGCVVMVHRRRAVWSGGIIETIANMVYLDTIYLVCAILRACVIGKGDNPYWCWHQFIADEATDASTIELMAICIRFYDDATHSIREDFLQFDECESTTGETFIKQLFKTAGIDISRMRGQGYDGAANMSG